MSKTLRIGMAAVTASAAMLSAAAPASAKGHNWKHHHDDNDGEVAAAAVVAGILGLAIGAAIMSSKHEAGAARPVRVGDYVSLPPAEADFGARVEAPEATPETRTCSRGDWVWDRFEKRYNWVITTVPC